MATNKKSNSKHRSKHEKRISKSAPKSSAEKQKIVEAERVAREKEAKKKAVAGRGKKIMAIVFSVLLILAFAIPSLTALSTCSQHVSSPEVQAAVDEAMATYDSGDSAGALQQLETLVQANPNDPNVWVQLGFVYSMTGANDKAIDAYNKAIEFDPNDSLGIKSLATSRLSEIQQ